MTVAGHAGQLTVVAIVAWWLYSMLFPPRRRKSKPTHKEGTQQW